jgi:predicted DNA-binding protein YlxM (UPF0122 family)
MARLSEPLRECLLLSILGDFSTGEIARMLDLQEAAVRQRLARARKQFQQFYALESGEQVSDSGTPVSSMEKNLEPHKQQSHKDQTSKQKKGEEGVKSALRPEERYFSMHNERPSLSRSTYAKRFNRFDREPGATPLW